MGGGSGWHEKLGRGGIVEALTAFNLPLAVGEPLLFLGQLKDHFRH